MKKLVADLDKIKSNNNIVENTFKELSKAINSFGSLDVTINGLDGDTTVTEKLQKYKNEIYGNVQRYLKEMEKYSTSVSECVSEYSSNENSIRIDTSDMLPLILKNPSISYKYTSEKRDSLLNINTQLIYYDPTLTYNDGGMLIPIYYQGDYYYVKLGDSNCGADGCGFTSCAMIATYLAQRKITPEEICSWSQDYYVSNSGMSWKLPSATAEHYGLGTVTQTNSIDKVVNALSEGKPVMSSQSRGLFTSGGHLIVLRGLDENGNILVNDPNSYNSVGKDYNNRAFTADEIDASAATYFIFNGN